MENEIGKKMLAGFSYFRSREAEVFFPSLDCRHFPSSGSFVVLHNSSGHHSYLAFVNSHGVGAVLSLVNFFVMVLIVYDFYGRDEWLQVVGCGRKTG